jgi:Na+-driven multidrug efflux pump
MRLCAVFCIASGLVVAGGLALASGFLPTLFSDSPEVINVTKTFLWIAPIGYGTYGVVMYVNASFNGLGKPMPGVAVSVMRIAVLYIPLALAGKALFGVVGIFAAYALANLLSGVIGYAWARLVVRRLFEREMALGR